MISLSDFLHTISPDLQDIELQQFDIENLKPLIPSLMIFQKEPFKNLFMGKALHSLDPFFVFNELQTKLSDPSSIATSSLEYNNCLYLYDACILDTRYILAHLVSEKDLDPPEEYSDVLTADEFNLWCLIEAIPLKIAFLSELNEWGLCNHSHKIIYATSHCEEERAIELAFAFAEGFQWKQHRQTHNAYALQETSNPTTLSPQRAPNPIETAASTNGSAPPPQKLSPQQAYSLPTLDLLKGAPQNVEIVIPEEELAENANSLETVLKNFRVRGEVMQVHIGPVVTLYELEPAPGTKSSTIINLADDIARSMSAVTARIALVPGRSVIGIELPNKQRESVYFQEILSSSIFQSAPPKLPLCLGKDIGGNPIVADLTKMPHLLIAGTTGAGKSVGINVMILSLLYKLPPEKCRFIMIDPKMLELSIYDGIPHLLTPVITEPQKAILALKWAVREMEHRYKIMSALNVRNIEGFNKKASEMLQRGEIITRQVQVGFSKENDEPLYENRPIDLTPFSYIVIIVDEMADLMLVAGKEIEATIQRLAQMARAAGIHIIMATQRPSVDVITGTIKANFPTRISFQVTSKIDSRTILGESGAEQLLGQGDMLFMTGGGRISRIHGAFISDSEVETVVHYIKSQGQPNYIHSITEDDPPISSILQSDNTENNYSVDDLYDQAVALILREKKVSISFVQRHLKIGYNRSARIVERMEMENIISTANQIGKREILIHSYPRE